VISVFPSGNKQKSAWFMMIPGKKVYPLPGKNKLPLLFSIELNALAGNAFNVMSFDRYMN
jgi:hypothetical protein